MVSNVMMRRVRELRFAVVGAYVADCLVSAPRLPAWNETHEAQSIRMAPGGKALNQAMALARLGAQVSAIGVLGDDGLGRDVLTAMVNAKIDTSEIVARRNVATPVCVCFVGGHAQTSFVWHIDEGVEVTKEVLRKAEATIRMCDALLITFELPLPTINAAIRIAHRNGVKVFLNPAPSLNTPSDTASVLWSQVDFLVPNEAEGRAILTGIGRGADKNASELAQALFMELEGPTVVVTLGESGCVVCSRGKARHHPAREATPVDTTGASDAFTAALAACLTAGASMNDAIGVASAAAAWTVEHPGGYESMPTSSALQSTT